MLTHAPGLFFEPTDALPQLVDALGGAGFGQAGGDLVQRFLEALGKAFVDGFLLLRPALTVAVEPHLPAIIGKHLLQLQGLTAGIVDGHGPLRSPNPAWVANSEADAAMRPIIEPRAAPRCGPVKPSDCSNPAKSTCRMAHRAAASTPTVRGRTKAMESTSTE